MVNCTSYACTGIAHSLAKAGASVVLNGFGNPDDIKWVVVTLVVTLVAFLVLLIIIVVEL